MTDRPTAEGTERRRRPPHLVIDARMIRHSGIGTYLRNLLPRIVASRPEWRFTLLGPARALRELPALTAANVTVRDCATPIYSIREQVALPRLVPGDANLFWATHYNLPLALRLPLLVTVHDVFHLAMPALVGGHVRRLYARYMFDAVKRRATHLLFTTEFTRGEFARHVGADGPPCSIVPLGVNPNWLASGAALAAPLDAPYVLYVGNVKPHKNVATLIRAFGRIRHDVPHHLAIVGRIEGMRTGDDEVRQLAAAMPDRVHLVGEVADAELAAWMRHADGFAFPSLYEGFGLPPLESMIAGCPCLVSRTASIPEVCGDAAHYCDPHRETDVADRLRELLTDHDLRATLRARGRDRAARFTWARCASGTLAAIEEALAA